MCAFCAFSTKQKASLAKLVQLKIQKNLDCRIARPIQSNENETGAQLPCPLETAELTLSSETKT